MADSKTPPTAEAFLLVRGLPARPHLAAQTCHTRGIRMLICYPHVSMLAHNLRFRAQTPISRGIKPGKRCYIALQH